MLLDLSVDPYLRGRMNPGPSYVPAFEVGKVRSPSSFAQVNLVALYRY